MGFYVSPKARSMILAAIESPFVLAIIFWKYCELLREVGSVSTSSRRPERRGVLRSFSGKTSPVFLSAILAATPG